MCGEGQKGAWKALGVRDNPDCVKGRIAQGRQRGALQGRRVAQKKAVILYVGSREV